MSAAAWLKEHAHELPAELGDTEGHLSLNYQVKDGDGEGSTEFGELIESHDTWFLPNSGLLKEEPEVTDPDAGWLF